MAKYIVTGTTILHDGKPYREGEPVDLEPKVAARYERFLDPVEAQKPRPAAELIKEIEAVADVSELEVFLNGEIRKTVLDAIEKRGRELTPE